MDFLYSIVQFRYTINHGYSFTIIACFIKEFVNNVYRILAKVVTVCYNKLITLNMVRT